MKVHLGEGEYGRVVALSGFTAQAKNFAKGKPRVHLMDGNELIDLMFAHYDHLNRRYGALVPLRRVFVPELPYQVEAYPFLAIMLNELLAR